jgi:hypothetical protein
MLLTITIRPWTPEVEVEGESVGFLVHSFNSNLSFVGSVRSEVLKVDDPNSSSIDVDFEGGGIVGFWLAFRPH